MRSGLPPSSRIQERSLEPLPDVVILHGIDDALASLMLTRLAQARERLSRIHPEFSQQVVQSIGGRAMGDWKWYTASREFIGLNESDPSNHRLSFGATDDVAGFTFTDRLAFHDRARDVGPAMSEGLVTAYELLDRFEACIRGTTVRQEQLRPRIARDDVVLLPRCEAAMRYRRSLETMLERYSVLHAQHGTIGGRARRVKLQPPSTIGHGELVNPMEGRSLLTREGLAMVTQGVPKALTMRMEGDQDFTLALPEIMHTQFEVPDPDPVMTMRIIAGLPEGSMSAKKLAPRHRR
jgi:hypothetical protein